LRFGIKELAMSPELSETIGYSAAFLTTAAFLPQAYKSWRTRDLSGISLPMYTLFTSGVAIWLVYGVLIASAPVIAANAITLLLSATVLLLKIKQVRAS
jgi:MtN3 and saliva related transmembrane protein